MSGQRLMIAMGSAALAAAIALLAWHFLGSTDVARSTDPAAVAADAHPPQLDCIFYRFTVERPTFEFMFNIEGELSAPRFEQLFVAEVSGSRRSVEKKEAPYPEWRFDPSTEPKRLQAEISVYDNSAQGQHAESVTIELYKYDPVTAGSGWIEAGLKSIHFQNLPGQCKQIKAVAAGAPAE